jgi:CheY-like chemotaxis protein
MIVDDEHFNILAIKGLLRVLGMKNIDNQVDVGYNGEDAVALVE